jgi:type I restriction enzyme M protein
LTSLNPGLARDRFDLILTNPPFGAMVKQTEKPYLTDYELAWLASKPTTGVEAEIAGTADPTAGKRALKQKTSVKTEIPFLERAWQFLKPGTGRMAIVLPDGILTNSSLRAVRDWLLERFQLLAVVSLPQFAFAHYGAGVKASVVFLRKRSEDETPSDDEPIFMAVAENIGYDATGRKTFKVVKQSIVGTAKIEIHRCDLFDMQVDFENVGSGAAPLWAERHRTVIPESGIVGQYWQFRKDPTPFFA